MSIRSVKRSEDKRNLPPVQVITDRIDGYNNVLSPELLENRCQDVDNVLFDEIIGKATVRKGYRPYITVDVPTATADNPVVKLYHYTPNNGKHKVIVQLKDGSVYFIEREWTAWVRLFKIYTGDLIIADGSLVVGEHYQICYIGTGVNASDFTTVSSADNNINTIFTANGIGNPAKEGLVRRVYEATEIEEGEAYEILALSFGGGAATDFETDFGAFANEVGLVFIATTDGTAGSGTGMVRKVSNWTAGNACSFATAENILWAVNGVDLPCIWDGDNSSTNSPYALARTCDFGYDYDDNTIANLRGGSFINGIAKFIAVRNSRVLLINTVSDSSKILYSSYYDSTGNVIKATNNDAWVSINFLRINKEDGHDITAFCEYLGNIFIAKGVNHYIIRGDHPEWAIVKLPTKENIIYPEAITTGNNLMFALKDNGICVLNGTEVNDITKSEIEKDLIDLPINNIRIIRDEKSKRQHFDNTSVTNNNLANKFEDGRIANFGNKEYDFTDYQTLRGCQLTNDKLELQSVPIERSYSISNDPVGAVQKYCYTNNLNSHIAEQEAVSSALSSNPYVGYYAQFYANAVAWRTFDPLGELTNYESSWYYFEATNSFRINFDRPSKVNSVSSWALAKASLNHGETVIGAAGYTASVYSEHTRVGEWSDIPTYTDEDISELTRHHMSVVKVKITLTAYNSSGGVLYTSTQNHFPGGVGLPGNFIDSFAINQEGVSYIIVTAKSYCEKWLLGKQGAKSGSSYLGFTHISVNAQSLDYEVNGCYISDVKDTFSTQDKTINFRLKDYLLPASTSIKCYLRESDSSPDNINEITASSIEIGERYQIVRKGDTDFTTVGATDNNFGTIFTATGTPSGSGYVTTNIFTAEEKALAVVGDDLETGDLTISSRFFQVAYYLETTNVFNTPSAERRQELFATLAPDSWVMTYDISEVQLFKNFYAEGAENNGDISIEVKLIDKATSAVIRTFNPTVNNFFIVNEDCSSYAIIQVQVTFQLTKSTNYNETPPYINSFIFDYEVGTGDITKQPTMLFYKGRMYLSYQSSDSEEINHMIVLQKNGAFTKFKDLNMRSLHISNDNKIIAVSVDDNRVYALFEDSVDTDDGDDIQSYIHTKDFILELPLISGNLRSCIYICDNANFNLYIDFIINGNHYTRRFYNVDYNTIMPYKLNFPPIMQGSKFSLKVGSNENDFNLRNVALEIHPKRFSHLPQRD